MTRLSQALPSAVRDSLPGVFLLYALAWRPSFAGRATRRELALALVIGWVLAVGLTILIAPAPQPDRGPGQASLAGSLFVLQFLLTLILAGAPMIATMVRRLHDSGRDGSALMVGLIPYLGVVILGVVLLLNPTPGRNAFGDNPRVQK